MFSTKDSAEAGFVTGALMGLSIGSSAFLFCSFLVESVMVIDKNRKWVYESLQDNYREISEIHKRTGDRMVVVWARQLQVLVCLSNWTIAPLWGGQQFSSLVLLLQFLSVSQQPLWVFSAKKGEQLGSKDVDFLWAEDIAVSEETALANSIIDLCRVIKQRPATGIRMNGWFRLTIISAAVALLFFALFEAIVSRG